MSQEIDRQHAPAPATVLLVDDMPNNLQLLKGLLKNSGHFLLTAKDGREALQVIADNPPDLVLLDVMMPEIDGFTVCRTVKSDPATRNIPIVMLTALNEIDDYVKGIDCGADDFISKPFNPQVLMARVNSYVKSKRTTDELERQKQFRHDLMRMVAHDLNNHMGAVLGYLDLLLTHSGIPEKDISKIEKAQSSAEEAAKVLRNFMSLEKCDAGTMTTNCVSMDICEQLRRAVMIKEVIFQRKKVDVVIEGVEPVVCPCDPDLINRVIHNLLDNAAKYATRETSLMVRVITTDQCVAFTISNRGPAIPPEDIPKVFDRFYQVQSGDLLQSRGTGLGLAFCKMAVEAQGGTISIASPAQGEPDGVTVTVSLPRQSTTVTASPTIEAPDAVLT